MNRLKVRINNIINKFQKKSIDVFRNIKDFFVNRAKKNLDKLKHFIWILKVILTYKPPKERKELRQFLQTVKISFSWNINKYQQKTKQFFRGIADFFTKTGGKIYANIKQFFHTIKISISRKTAKLQKNTALFFLSIKEFFAGFNKKLTFKRKLSFPNFKKIIQNTANFFLFLKNLGARHTIRVDLFLIIIILILMLNPFIINNIGSSEVKTKQVNLFLSVNSEKLPGNEITKTLLEEFNSINPDIQVFLIDWQADDAEREPDILIFDESEYNSFFTSGKLAELSAYIIEEHHDEITVSSQTAELPAAKPSERYAIPLVSFMDMLFYNIEILSAAGFDHPPKTREEFIKCAGAVSRGNFPGMSGALLSLSSDDHRALSRDIFSWLWASGVNFWQEPAAESRSGEIPSAAGDKPLLASSANMRAITGDFTFLAGIYREAQTHGIFERTGSQSLEEFAQGKVALLITSTSNIPYLRERMGEGKFGITTIPGSGTGGRYGITLSSIFAGINSSTPHTDEESQLAMSRFLKFLSEKTDLFCAELKAIPGSIINPIPGKYIRDDSFYSKAWDIFEASRIVQSFSGKPGAEEYETIFLEELRQFFEGEKNAQQTIVSIQRRWDDVRISD